MPAYTLGDLKIAATHAYRFLRLAMLDIVNGGVYWSSAYDGLPGDTLKHTYCQAFAIYGLAAYYEISKDQSALDLAYAIMDVIETKCRDEKGYLEAFTMDWQPHSNEELSENGVEAKRTMNTLLHCFEAYTELYRVDRNEKVRKILIEEANLFMQYYYNPERKRQEVFFDLDYNTLIDLHSYGHDIETSWLMEKGIDLIDDAELTKKMKPAFRAMEEHTFEAAFDETAFINECENGVDDTKRIWWVECEAIIGFVNRAQHEAAGKMMAENLRNMYLSYPLSDPAVVRKEKGIVEKPHVRPEAVHHTLVEMHLEPHVPEFTHKRQHPVTLGAPSRILVRMVIVAFHQRVALLRRKQAHGLAARPVLERTEIDTRMERMVEPVELVHLLEGISIDKEKRTERPLARHVFSPFLGFLFLKTEIPPEISRKKLFTRHFLH